MHRTTKRALAVNALLFSSASLLLFACGHGSTVGAVAPADAGAVDGASGDVAVSSDAAATGDAASPVGTLTINEVSGKGDEWVEVINSGTTPVDVSGYKVTDGEKDGGAPNHGNEGVFPTGTTIPPGGYVIVMGLPEGGTTCVAPVGVPCFNGKFSISSSQGDLVYFLNSSNGVVAKVSYPANTVTTGHTWGRLPNGTGAFQITTKTPGLENKP